MEDLIRDIIAMLKGKGYDNPELQEDRVTILVGSSDLFYSITLAELGEF